jgi:hypothetical protein
MGEAFDSSRSGSGRRDTWRCSVSHSAVWAGRSGQILGEHAQDAVGELGGGGEFRAHEGGDLGRAARGAGDLDRHLAQAFVADDLAADQEGVAGGEGGGEGFLDLAQRGPMRPLSGP